MKRKHHLAEDSTKLLIVRQARTHAQALSVPLYLMFSFILYSYSFLRRPENFAFTETSPAGSALDAHPHKTSTRLKIEGL